MRLWPRRKVYLDNLPKTHDLRFGVVFVVGLALVFTALYGVGYAVAGNKLPAGTTVAKVDVGGMSPDQARTVLQDKLVPRLEEPIEATAAGQTFSLDPQRTGLTFDIDATLSDALGGSPWDPRHMLHVLMGGGELDPVVDLDNAELAHSLRHIADHVERKAVDSSVSFGSGQPQVSYGQAGRALDYQRSGDRLEDALVAGDTKVALAVEAVQPQVTTLEATRFADSVGRQAVSAPVRVRVADSAVTLQPHVFAPALLAVASGGDLTLDVDQAKLAERCRSLLTKLPHHPVNARIRFVGDKPAVVPGTSGVTVTPPDLAKAVLKAVQRSGDTRSVRATATPDNPRVSTQDARMMRIKERVASATARYVAVGKGLDPTGALRQLDGSLIRPDATYGVVSHVANAGSPEATFAASLLYDAAFFAGLDVPEHTPSRFHSDAFAPGLDAQVDPPAVDLVVHNSTPYGVYVRAFVDPGNKGSSTRTAHLELWSTRYWKVKAHTSDRYNVVRPQVITNTRRSCVPRDGIAGFDVDVTRDLTRDGFKRSESTHASYLPLDQVRCSQRSSPTARP